MKTRIEQNEPNDPVSGEASGTPTIQTVEVNANSATAPTSGFRAFVRRRELVIFFVLCYLIGWSALPWGSFIAFAPLISAIVVVSIAEGLPAAITRILRRRARRAASARPAGHSAHPRAPFRQPPSTRAAK